MRLIAFVRTLCTQGLLAGAAALLAAQGAWAQEPIRVGAFLSVTGPAAFLGDPELKTLELYVERLNAEGGVLGRKLQLVAYDDAGDAEKARTFAKRLLEQDKVDLIVGGSTTGTTMAVVPLVEQAGVPFVSLAGAVVIVEPAKKWVFKTPHTDRMACEKIFVDLQSRKHQQGGADLGQRRLRQVDARRVPEGGAQVRHRVRRRRDLRRHRHRHDRAAHQDQGQRRAGGAQRRLRPGPGDRHAQLPPGGADAAAVPVARRRVEGIHQALRPCRRRRAPARRGAAGGRPAGRRRCAEARRRRLQQGLRGQVQGRRLHLRRPCLRRADAGGERDQVAPARPTRPRCATRSRPPRATSAPAAWSTCRPPTTWGWT